MLRFLFFEQPAPFSEGNKMTVINIEDLKKYRADRIAVGNCDHDEMEALAWFINTVDTIEIEESE